MIFHEHSPVAAATAVVSTIDPDRREYPGGYLDLLVYEPVVLRRKHTTRLTRSARRLDASKVLTKWGGQALSSCGVAALPELTPAAVEDGVGREQCDAGVPVVPLYQAASSSAQARASSRSVNGLFGHSVGQGAPGDRGRVGVEVPEDQ